MITYKRVKKIKTLNKLDKFLNYLGFCVVLAVDKKTDKIQKFWIGRTKYFHYD